MDKDFLNQHRNLLRIMANGETINQTAMEKRHFQMAIDTKVTSKTVTKMVQGLFSGQMVDSTKESSRKAICKATVTIKRIIQNIEGISKKI